MIQTSAYDSQSIGEFLLCGCLAICCCFAYFLHLFYSVILNLIIVLTAVFVAIGTMTQKHSLQEECTSFDSVNIVDHIARPQTTINLSTYIRLIQIKSVNYWTIVNSFVHNIHNRDLNCH